MATVASPVRVFDEIADLIASSPDRETLLAYRFSPEVQRRASQLLEKNRQSTLSQEEQEELDELTRAESFIVLIKARVMRKTQA